MTLKAAELFAGVGGFRLGLEKAGIDVVWSNQWEPGQSQQWASRVYEHRFGSEGHANEDIHNVLDELERNPLTVPHFDLVVGGFPCQDYSVAKSLSSSRGLEGKKGVLWWEIHRLLALRKPRYVLLENVDRLLSSPSTQRGRDFSIMLSSLASLGYVTAWRVINASDYGHPQRRKRVFIFAQIETCEVDIFSEAFPASDPISISSFELDSDLVRLSKSFNIDAKHSPFLSAGRTHGRKVQTWIHSPTASNPTPLSNLVIDASLVPDEYWIPLDQVVKWQFLKGGKSISRVGRGGFAYSYSEGSMAFPDPLNRPARTVVTGEGGPTPSRFKHVIEQGGRLRRLTPIELERINEFPDDWTKYSRDGVEVPPARRAFLMGNALVVGVIEKLATGLRKAHEVQSNR